jgi:hypothetical protein
MVTCSRLYSADRILLFPLFPPFMLLKLKLPIIVSLVEFRRSKLRNIARHAIVTLTLISLVPCLALPCLAFALPCPALPCPALHCKMEESTFLEEFVQAIELLPNDVRRNFELIRELDRDSGEMARECLEIGVLLGACECFYGNHIHIFSCSHLFTY